MTYRKAVLYRILALVAVVAMAALSWLTFYFVRKPAHAQEASVQAEAQPTHDVVFGANHANATEISAPPTDKYMESGTYCLADDIELTYGLELLGTTVNLCLHGHSITVAKDRVFGLYGSSTVLNIYDCGGTGVMTGGRSEGFYLYNGATLNMYGGTIKDCPDSGVSVSGGSVFNMYGGAITDNVSSSNAGGVGVWTNGTFNMYGGTISNNTTTKHYGGAGVDITSANSVFRMYGGSIINNVIDCTKVTSEESLNLFYKGAGVDFGTGTFSIEGDVIISGNIRKTASAQVINNVELDGSKRQIEITGPLGSNARIGVTSPASVFTTGYFAAGNTADPSEYFTSDNGMTIGFDDLNKEAEIKTGSIVGGYNMIGATVTGVSGTATVGDTSVTLIVDVTLQNNVDHSTKTISDVVTVNLSSPLVGGENTVNADYTYNGADGNNTEHLTYKFTPAKKRVSVKWACSDSATTSDGINAVKRTHDSKDILGTITASYTGYDGVQKTVVGTSNDIKVTNETGNTVSSTADIGVYTISLAPSADYEFDNNTFTLTVSAVVDNGYYKVQSVVAVGATGTPTVGDTTVTVSVRKTFKHTKTGAEKTETESKQVALATALVVGNNDISFNYTYNDEREGEKTIRLTLAVTAAKKQVTVAWYFNNSVASANSASRDYDGDDALGLISAKFTGYDGTQKTVSGASSGVIVKDSNSTVVSSAVNAGVYTVSLAPQTEYEFSNNVFTLTINAVNVDDGYYKVQSVTAIGAAGTPTAGDKTITVSVRKTLKHTKTGNEKTETATAQVVLASALHGGENKIAFDYKYNDVVDGEKTVRLALTVIAAKKQAPLTWYYNGSVATGDQAIRIYDGVDASDIIIAEYVGIDGAKQRVDGKSALMLKKMNGNTVASLSVVGEYMLSLADSADYVFGNNSFVFIVVENLGNITDLTYEENQEVILGVSSNSGFAAGTEVVVEKVSDLDDGLVDGKISSALNVSFVNNATVVTPTGTVTVRVLIPDALKDGAKYKIYNLNNGVATEVRFTSDGDYATFELSELSTILFVTEESMPIINPNPSNPNVVVKLGGAELLWIWVLLFILSVAVITVVIVLIVMAKRGNKK